MRNCDYCPSSCNVDGRILREDTMEAKISTYVRELLPNVDLLTTTERDIRGMVAKELGVVSDAPSGEE